MIRKIYSKIHSSISAKFFTAFLLLLIFPLLLITQLFVTRLHAVLKAKELSSTQEKISFAQNEFNRLFSDMDRIATSLILDYHVTDILSDPAPMPSYEWFKGYKSLNSILELLNSNAGYKYRITVLSHDDRMYHSTAPYNSMIKTDSPIIHRISQGNGNPVLFNRALESYDDNQTICLGRSIYQKGNYLGSILVEIPVSCLDELLTPFENDSTFLYVLENNKKILYSSESIQNAYISSDLSHALARHKENVSLNDTDFLLLQMPTSQKGLSIVTLISESSVFYESSHVIQLFIFAFFLSIAAAVGGIILLTRSFTKDILALNHAVSGFGTDVNFSIELPIRSEDEIGQLTQGVISMSHRIRQLLTRIQQEEENKRIMELNSLQSQINPHMIYNTLNTITWLAEVQNVQNIREISSSFAHLLRALSNQGQFISIRQEVEYLKAFISIKKYHLLCSIQTDFQIDETAMDYLIPKLLLQPIVENAIIHGFADQLEDGLIALSVRLEQQKLLIDISDTGKGMSESQINMILTKTPTASATFLRVGIHNVIERLQLWYGKNADFSIASAPGCGTTIHLALPAQPISDSCPNKKEIDDDKNSFSR